MLNLFEEMERSRFSYTTQTEDFRNLNSNLQTYLSDIKRIDEENLQLQKHIEEIRRNYVSTLENQLKRLPDDFRQESLILTDAHLERYKSKSRAKRFLHEREELKKRIHFLANNEKHQFKQINQLQKHEQKLLHDCQNLNQQFQHVYTYVQNEKQLHRQAMAKVDRLQAQLEQTSIERSKTEFEIQTLREEVQLMQTVKEFLDDEHQNILLTQTEANDYLLSRLNESIAHIREDFNQLNQSQLKNTENEYKQMIERLEEDAVQDETLRHQQRTMQVEYEQLENEHQILAKELFTLNSHNEILSERVHAMENDLYQIRDERTRELLMKDNELERNQIELQSLNEKLNYLIEYDRNLKFELTLYRGVLESEYRRKQQQLNINQPLVRPTTLRTVTTTKSNRNTSSKNSSTRQQITPNNERNNNQTSNSLSTPNHSDGVPVPQSSFGTDLFDQEATLFSNSPSIPEFSIPLNEYLITSETPQDDSSPTNTSAEENQFAVDSSAPEKTEVSLEEILPEQHELSTQMVPTEEKQESLDRSTTFEEQNESANTLDLPDSEREPTAIPSEEKQESLDRSTALEEQNESANTLDLLDSQQEPVATAIPSEEKQELSTTSPAPEDSMKILNLPATTNIQEDEQEMMNDTEESENQPDLANAHTFEEKEESTINSEVSQDQPELSSEEALSNIPSSSEDQISTSNTEEEQQETPVTEGAAEEEQQEITVTEGAAEEEGKEEESTDPSIDSIKSKENADIVESEHEQESPTTPVISEEQPAEHQETSNVPEDQPEPSTIIDAEKQQESETNEQPTSPIHTEEANDLPLSTTAENEAEPKEELVSSSNEQSNRTGFLSSAGYYGASSDATHYINQGHSKASSRRTSLTDIEIDSTGVIGEASSRASPRIEENESADVTLEHVLDDLRYVYRSLVNVEGAIEINDSFSEKLLDRLEFKDTLIQNLFHRLLLKYIIEPAKSAAHSKTLDWIEFRDILFPILTCRYTEGHIRKLFNLFDLNQNEYLSSEEVTELLELLQLENPAEFAQKLSDQVTIDELLESIRNSDEINLNLLPADLEDKVWYLQTPVEDDWQSISIEVPSSEKNHAGIVILLGRIFKRVGIDIESRRLDSTKPSLSMKLTNEFIHNNIAVSNEDLHPFIELYLNRKQNTDIFIHWHEFRDMFLPLVNGGLITKDDLHQWIEILDVQRTKAISEEQILHLFRLLQIPRPEEILVKIQDIHPNKNASWTYEEFLFAFENLDQTSLHLLSTNDQITAYNIDWFTRTSI